MGRYLCVTVTLLDPLFHGRADHDEPEWPPSPLRLFQAILCGTRTGCRDSQWSDTKAGAFKWLEEQSEPPFIVAPHTIRANRYSLFVPNNDSDKKYERHNRLTSKSVHPHRLPDQIEHRAIHYLWPIKAGNGSLDIYHAEVFAREARNLTALGWGIDQAVATGRILTEQEFEAIKQNGIPWKPLQFHQRGAAVRRFPRKGTLRNLEEVYICFVDSVNGKQYMPPPNLSVFNRAFYAPPGFMPLRPCAVFELRHDNGEYCRYSQRKLIHIAGMVRHLAKWAMQASPPTEVDDDWVERYVIGHRPENEENHRQFSYLPLPSIGHEHADQIVRRVMITAPLGDERLLEHLTRRLSGQQLRPERDDHFGETGPPTLVRVQNDNVARAYTRPANRWASVTPVILPGHDDKKPAKTRKLIEKALAQSGIEQPCEFEWSPFSIFRKSFSAHKYDRNKNLQGYFRPSYLENKTAVHIRLRFDEDLRVPGPLFVGAGRHCGLGLMASIFGESVPSTTSKQGGH